MSDPVLPPRRPGGQMASRPLHFFWLADGSGSMRVDGKIQALNNAIREAIPHMQTVARENPHASVYVRAIRFSDTAEWLEEEAIPALNYRWNDIEAGGVTALGDALSLVANELQAPLMTDRALQPVIALVTDGLPTDDIQVGLQKLLAQPWGRQALRIVVAIGEDATSHEAQNVFRAFMGNDFVQPLQANNPEALMEQIRWVSTATIKSVSSPANQIATAGIPFVFSGAMAMANHAQEEADVW